jgi:phosphoribosyl 1,2-cyclic phosphodiesterase
MPLSISILASSSSGNCSVVRSAGGAMLIDCGIGPRVVAARLTQHGIDVDALSAIMLTHLDSDHFNINWVETIVRRSILVYCPADRVSELVARVDRPGFERSLLPFDHRPFSPFAPLHCQAIRLPHDQHGSHGFTIEDGEDCRLAYATDLGRAIPQLIERFAGAGVLAIECNYDPRMQLGSGRPTVLQRRIMGGRGHLSNEQSFWAVQNILNRSEKIGHALPSHVVLLHRSRQCNCPNLVRNVFSADDRLKERLVLAEPDRPTGWLHAEARPMPWRQMVLPWG